VTVEKKTGAMTHGGRNFTIIDLPGTYSLAPRSMDEMVAVDVLFGRGEASVRPEAVVCIIDAKQLGTEPVSRQPGVGIGLPTVVALNMIDSARERGLTIDAAKLGQCLGATVVETQANRGVGLEPFERSDRRRLRWPRRSLRPIRSARVSTRSGELERAVQRAPRRRAGAALPRRALLLDTSGYLQGRVFGDDCAAIAAAIRRPACDCRKPALRCRPSRRWLVMPGSAKCWMASSSAAKAPRWRSPIASTAC